MGTHMILSTKQSKIGENIAHLNLAIGQLKQLHTTVMDEDYGISTDQVLAMITRAEQIREFMGECADKPVHEG